MHTCIVVVRKELPLNQKNRGAAIEKPLFVVQGCLEMHVSDSEVGFPWCHPTLILGFVPHVNLVQLKILLASYKSNLWTYMFMI